MLPRRLERIRQLRRCGSKEFAHGWRGNTTDSWYDPGMDIIASFPMLTPFDEIIMLMIYGLLAFGAIAIPFKLWKRFVERRCRDRDTP
jgi:hypothetical protein